MSSAVWLSDRYQLWCGCSHEPPSATTVHQAWARGRVAGVASSASKVMKGIAEGPQTLIGTPWLSACAARPSLSMEPIALSATISSDA